MFYYQSRIVFRPKRSITEKLEINQLIFDTSSVQYRLSLPVDIVPNRFSVDSDDLRLVTKKGWCWCNCGRLNIRSTVYSAFNGTWLEYSGCDMPPFKEFFINENVDINQLIFDIYCVFIVFYLFTYCGMEHLYQHLCCPVGSIFHAEVICQCHPSMFPIDLCRVI